MAFLFEEKEEHVLKTTATDFRTLSLSMCSNQKKFNCGIVPAFKQEAVSPLFPAFLWEY